jgi:predicted SnoaL-like aldol condensation-catalyzing enzyme
MSQENIELVRAAYREGYQHRTVEPLRDTVAGDFRFHMRRGWPGRPVYRFDEMTQIWADLDETYSEFRLAPEDYAAVGDYVLVTIRQSARMRGSDSRVESTIWHVWRITDGLVREAWTFDSEKDALEAAGLKE